MELFDNLLLGFSTALTLQNVIYAFIGCLLGALIRILPGLGPLATISMLLPITFGLDPTSALIMLAGIYYGAAYGGSTTAILVNLPGETSSVVTVIDGYQMARQGRAGVAIATAAIGSFFAGCVGTLVLAVAAAPLSTLAFKFGAAEYFSLMMVGLIGAVSLSSGSVIKAIGMILIGIILGTVGTDINTGVQRFTFGEPHLWEGLDFIVIAVGVFAFGEVVGSLEDSGVDRQSYTKKIGRLMPSGEDVRRMIPSILRGTGIGAVLGVLPGAGLAIASFMSYSLEKKVSRFRHLMGKGAIEGVGIVLGSHRLHVDRQRDAGDPQPAAGGRLGEAAGYPVSDALPGNHSVLLPWRLCLAILHLRSFPGCRLRSGWIRLPQARVRARTDGTGLRARPAD